MTFLRSLAPALAFLIVGFLSGTLAAEAANPSVTGYINEGTCTYQGQSDITVYEHGTSATYPIYMSGCGSMHVHAYFWGSDSVYHFMSDTAYFGANVLFPWWTNSVYGYHNLAGESSPPFHETHAY